MNIAQFVSIEPVLDGVSEDAHHSEIVSELEEKVEEENRRRRIFV